MVNDIEELVRLLHPPEQSNLNEGLVITVIFILVTFCAACLSCLLLRFGLKYLTLISVVKYLSVLPVQAKQLRRPAKLLSKILNLGRKRGKRAKTDEQEYKFEPLQPVSRKTGQFV